MRPAVSGEPDGADRLGSRRRRLASLHLLEGEGPERFAPAAGIPNYIGLFGRDTLMASWQSALLNPATLRGTLRLVGRLNAEQRDDRYEAGDGARLRRRRRARHGSRARRAGRGIEAAVQ